MELGHNLSMGKEQGSGQNKANSRSDETDPLIYWPKGPLISSANIQSAPRA